jgi:hypothetical protein
MRSGRPNARLGFYSEVLLMADGRELPVQFVRICGAIILQQCPELFDEARETAVFVALRRFVHPIDHMPSGPFLQFRDFDPSVDPELLGKSRSLSVLFQPGRDISNASRRQFQDFRLARKHGAIRMRDVRRTTFGPGALLFGRR